jgi:MFS family permease
MSFKLEPSRPSAFNTTDESRRDGAPPARQAPTSSAGRAPRTLSIAASGTALVMAVFSAFVVNVGDSVRALHAGVAGEAWGLSGMSLGLVAALLTAGALADDLGHQRVLRCSAGLLAAASAIGALAPSIEILVAARVLQGVAGGGILAAGLGSIGRTFPSGRRAYTRLPFGGQPSARGSWSARSLARPWRRRSAGAVGSGSKRRPARPS